MISYQTKSRRRTSEDELRLMGTQTRHLLLAVCILVVAVISSPAAEDFLKPNTTINVDGLEVLMRNWDLAKSRKILFVHFVIRNREKVDRRCDWKELAWLIRPDGRVQSSNYDALVDSGTGFTRATGPVLVPRGGRRIKISVPFLLNETDLPARIRLPNGSESPTFR